MTTKKHPIQPITNDADGVLRFKSNAIVRHLLDNGGIDMNQLACMDFSADDRKQFAQLIGYSLTGFGELSYVSVETYSAALLMAETGGSDIEALAAVYHNELKMLRAKLREPIAALYGIASDVLGPPNAE